MARLSPKVIMATWFVFMNCLMNTQLLQSFAYELCRRAELTFIESLRKILFDITVILSQLSINQEY